MQVIARDGESVEELLSRFKRGMARSGILKDLKKRRFFVGPGEQRRMEGERGRPKAEATQAEGCRQEAPRGLQLTLA